MSEQPPISLELKMGAKQPKAVPEAVALALSSVQVNRKFKGISGFSLTFQAERYGADASAKEYPLLDTGLLDPFNRVYVAVQVGGDRTVLMDGYVTRQEISVSAEGGTTVSLTGEDVSVKMDLFDVYKEYTEGQKPNKKGMKDSSIAKEILTKYKPLGISARVTPPQGEALPEKPRQQRATDRAYLERLAKLNSCVFFVDPEDTVAKSTAYWGPFQASKGQPQKALTINMGPADNLTTVSLSYNSMVPSLTFGRILKRQGGKKKIEKVAAGSPSKDAVPAYFKKDPISSSFRSLAETPEKYVTKLQELDVHGRLANPERNTGSDEPLKDDRAQSETDQSIQEVVSANGTVDTSIYGAVIDVRASIDLRGVGERYDGTYLVQEVSHKLSFEIEKWSYTQDFNLVRGGMMTTISKVSQWQ